MEEYTCKNCGGNSFHKKANKIICDYCKSETIDPDWKPRTIVVKETKPVKKKKWYQNKFIWLLVVVLFIGGFSALGTIREKNVKVEKLKNTEGAISANYEVQKDYGLKHIEKIPKWSKEIYDGINLATENRDSQKIVTYSEGSLYKDLVAKVGNPNTATSNINKYDGTTIIHTDFDTDFNGDYHIYIDISYDKASGMIISKDIRGYKD